jgi:hypothetical protein
MEFYVILKRDGKLVVKPKTFIKKLTFQINEDWSLVE